MKKARFRLATPRECLQQTGFHPGKIPAVGLPQPFEVVLDASISSHRPVVVLAAPKSLQVDGFSVLISLSLSELHFLCEGAKLADCSRIVDDKYLKQTSSTGYDAARSIPLNPRRERRDASEIPFLCDAMLSKLGRWLRVLGCDVVIFEEGRDRGLLLDEATQLNRVLLTKDSRRAAHASSATKTAMMKNRVVSSDTKAFVVLVEGGSTRTQLREVTEFLNLEFRREHFMSRCSTCNGKGFRDATVEEVRASGMTVERVIRKVSQFLACLSCGKFYWEGPKFNSAKNLLEGYVTENDRS